MVILKKILLLVFLIVVSFTQCSQDYPRNKEGKPTSVGISNYITENKYHIIDEVQLFIKEILTPQIYYDRLESGLEKFPVQDSIALSKNPE